MTANLAEIKKIIKKKLTEERYLHSVGAEKAARELAAKFGEDVEKAGLAALLHDIAKCVKHKELVKIVKENNFPIPQEVIDNRKVLHAYAGAYLVQKEFGITDRDILNAIMYHTTGRAGMSLLEKIVYLSDKIETKTRPIEYTDKIVKILEETGDIDKTILATLNITIKSLVDRDLVINIQTINFWNQLIIKIYD